MKGWAFLRSNDVPKHFGDNKPLIYQNALTAVDRIGIDFDLLPNHSVKTFYNKLLPPPPRKLPCMYGWEGRLNTTFNWPKIWQHIYGGLSTNWESDITWKIAHGVVKTRAYLKSWGLKVGESCAGCGERESISHAFCECRLVSPVWGWMSTLVNRLYSTPITFTNSLILFRHELPRGKQFSKPNELCSVLIKITLNELWAARNLGTFESKRSTVSSIIAKIKARIRFRIKAAFNHSVRPDFLKSWAHNNVLCSVANKKLILNL